MNLERLRGLFRHENKEFKPNDLQNKVLTIGAQWRMEGLPWWTIGTMSERVAEYDGKSPHPYRLINGVNSLAENGGLEKRKGILGFDDSRLKPLQDVPVSDNESANYFNYYCVTEEGNKMRGRTF